MIVRKDDGESQEFELSSTWVYILPENRKSIHIIGAYSKDGMTKYKIDNERIVDGVVTIQFGIDQHSGVLKYSYEIFEENKNSVELLDGKIVINMTQTNHNSDTSPQ